MRPNVPSYVVRPADTELYEKILAGDFCYVLTPRQMGKSSLMVRTSRRLREEGTQTVIIDLTEFGSVAIDKWYLGLLTKLQRDLHLSIDVKSWWQENKYLGEPQRFYQFITDIVLPDVSGNIVIFIDEIDSTLNLDFRDDFFANMRAFYNGRSRNPELARVVFVLLGVASPSELIEDRLRTPFNIGYEINLQEFDRQDSHVLELGLSAIYPEQGQAIFDRIFHWTNGHPYLTQQLCVHIAENNSQNWNDNEIDELVNQLFLQDEARGETNIQFVSDRILKSPQRASLLKLYKKVHKGKLIEDDKQSLTQSQLLLSGLVKIDDRHLAVSNQIYRQAFDLAWIRKETATNWTPLIIGLLVAIIVLIGGVFARDTWLLPYRAAQFENDFLHAREEEEAPTRTAALVNMHNISPLTKSDKDYERRARELFFDPLNPWPNQSTILNPEHFKDPEEILVLISSNYLVLADVDNSGDTTRLLKKMNESLEQWPDENEDITRLKFEIQKWLEAREEQKAGNHGAARGKYNEAVQVNPENPATRFELARVYILLATIEGTETNYDSALSELDKVVEIAFRVEPDSGETPVPIPTIVTTPTPTPTTTRIVPTSTSRAPIVDSATSNAQTTTGTPALVSPTPNPRPVIPTFDTRNQRVGAVMNLLEIYPELHLYAQQANETSYTNLRTIGFIPQVPTMQEGDSLDVGQDGVMNLGEPQKADGFTFGPPIVESVLVSNCENPVEISHTITEVKKIDRMVTSELVGEVEGSMDASVIVASDEVETSIASGYELEVSEELDRGRQLELLVSPNSSGEYDILWRPVLWSGFLPIYLQSGEARIEYVYQQVAFGEVAAFRDRTAEDCGDGEIATITPDITPVDGPLSTPTVGPLSTPTVFLLSTPTVVGDILFTTLNRIYSIDLSGLNEIEHGEARPGADTCGVPALTVLGEIFELHLGSYCGIGDRGTGQCSSPNGQYEVLTQSESLSETSVAVRPVGSEEALFVFSGRLDRSEGIRWAPNSDKFLFVAGDTVYAAFLDGSYNEIIPTAYEPQFSPGGDLILYTKPVGPGIVDIFVSNADGTQSRSVTNAAFNHEPPPCPRWSRS